MRLYTRLVTKWLAGLCEMSHGVQPKRYRQAQTAAPKIVKARHSIMRAYTNLGVARLTVCFW